LVAVVAVAQAQPVPGYRELAHTSGTGVFRAYVPTTYGAPEVFNVDEPSPVGNVHGTGYQVINEVAASALLSMIHYQAPEGYEQGRTQQQVLRDMLEGLVGGVGGSITQQRPVNMGPYPGLEAEFSAIFEGLSLTGRVRIYLIGNEAVGVYFMGMSGAATLADPVGQAFIDSLAYTPNTTP
jgi:hypothetical protein